VGGRGAALQQRQHAPVSRKVIIFACASVHPAQTGRRKQAWAPAWRAAVSKPGRLRRAGAQACLRRQAWAPAFDRARNYERASKIACRHRANHASMPFVSGSLGSAAAFLALFLVVSSAERPGKLSWMTSDIAQLHGGASHSQEQAAIAPETEPHPTRQQHWRTI
jgi:hypothetical protein